MMRKNNIYSLYIHIPFCEHLCDYCDFPKLQYFRTFAEKYLVALKSELDSYHIEHELKTIYVGGGTPTALEDDLFEQFLKIINPYTKGVVEYTFEANPESLSEKKLSLMKQYGVNRISIGVESTDDKILASINRHHSFSDVKTAISSARKIGFDNLNVDLIIGLPHVSEALFRKDLANILELDVEHISLYSLTVHPHTVFSLKGIEEPKEEFARKLYDIAEETLKANGFIHYEVSNWANPGRESKHNFTYWKDEQYYGIGYGASGYVGNMRYTNTRNLDKYLSGQFIEEEEIVDLKDDKTYFIMLNLRTNQGIDLEEYQNRFSEDLLEVKKTEIKNFTNQGLLKLDKENHRLTPTYNGMMILDQIILELIK